MSKKHKKKQQAKEIAPSTAVVSTPDKKQLDWSEVISAHTSGKILKNDKIRLRFVNKVINEANLGKSANHVISIEPKIDGEFIFVNRYEIQVSPTTALTSGQHYKVRLSPTSFDTLKEIKEDYEFDFSVTKQDFEINVTGLSTNGNDDKIQMVTGQIVTADHEDNAKIEQLLSATYLQRAIKISWQHEAFNKKHHFFIKQIKRQQEGSTVALTWNGEVINVDNSGQHEIDIPALGHFELNSVKAMRGDEQYIEIEFSDKIDPKQDLTGLIRIGNTKFSKRIEQNIIKLYPNKRLVGVIAVTLDPSIKNIRGKALGVTLQRSVVFDGAKPQVSFVGNGVILPDNQFLSIPFKAINVDSVEVTAFQIFENNIGYFLQSNNLNGDEELQRVGRYLWRKKITLKSPKAEQWNNYLLDATELLKKHPGSLFRLTLSINRSNSIYSCKASENAVAVPQQVQPINYPVLQDEESSSWDWYGEEQPDMSWQDRNNPCQDAYYLTSDNASSSRNYLASNIGIIVKQGSDGKIDVVSTDIRTAAPLNQVKFEFRNLQNQLMGSASSDYSGFASVQLASKPFYLVAQKGKQRAYLKMSEGSALPTSHFDVGGEKISKGIKGHIYAERGVWRPGDNLHLTFVLQDKNDLIPAKHPVTMQLFNPQGQLMQTLSNNQPVGDFYRFDMKTQDADLTGNWTARATLGGSTFTKSLKIETVTPNRLKLELNFDSKNLYQAQMPVATSLFGQWLHGASAENLTADVAVTLSAIPTRFTRFTDYGFDDPSREFNGSEQVLFEGQLDAEGRAEFNSRIKANNSPGMLKAHFVSRVFENSGAFSSSRSSAKYYPYDNYVGIKLPKGDQARGMLLTDTTHKMEVGTLSAAGEPVSLDKVQVTMYKIHWKWWWDKSGDSLAKYASASHHSKIKQDVISTVNGKGSWEFDIKYPDWGRYLIRACDLDGNHCTGKILYIDWPGWAGRAQEGNAAGASSLTFSADKASYQVGETAIIQLPEATQGRALISVENGSTVIEQHWVEFTKANTQYKLPLTSAMSPNVYINLTLLQPHEDKKNDRPIRLYGVIPLMVSDPQTRLSPEITTANEWLPESVVDVGVNEKSGLPMTYTLAVVDEGLLGLTSFKTPNLHKAFYKKEALGVTTWDMFDDVTGAYGGELERLLALGGSDDGDNNDSKKDKKRFPPVVQFLGPFQLKANEQGQHKIALPQYVGAVRVMVVAGKQGAFGKVSQSVYVRQALTLLATVPRVLGPEEELTVPVTLFVMDDAIKELNLSIESDDYVTVVGDSKIKLAISKQGEYMAYFKLKVNNLLGISHLKLKAVSGKNQSQSDVHVEVRSPNPATLRQWHQAIKPGEQWRQVVAPHGLPNTNTVTLEISAVPPINLQRRLQYLIQYPHGCVEQVTSSVFPQLYLQQMMALDELQKREIEKNVNAGIERLRAFQNEAGGLTYWSGNRDVNAWATNYVGHFLLEAEKKGFHVPVEMKNNWLSYQQNMAKAWLAAGNRTQLDQAYRLYTLALAGKAELGAMNRLRELKLSTIARWQLAAAYSLAGLDDAATELAGRGLVLNKPFQGEDATFGSELRDQAIVLNSLVLLDKQLEAKGLADEIAKALSTQEWHSTQTLAYSLFAMASFIGDDELSQAYEFEYKLGSSPSKKVDSTMPIFSTKLAETAFQTAVTKEETAMVKAETLNLKNASKRTLYATVSVLGVPKAGAEKALAEGLAIKVDYRNADSNDVDITKLKQSMDVEVAVEVSNNTDAKLDNLALTHIYPSGWEIQNRRLDADDAKTSLMDHQDIRDDRVLSYFSLKAGEKKQIITRINAAYLGRYYLPSISVEAMYDATKQARTKGRWVEVNSK